MSLENHPNFHAVKFAADISSSYYKSLRIDVEDAPSIRNLVVEFVSRVEEMVDETRKEKK